MEFGGGLIKYITSLILLFSALEVVNGDQHPGENASVQSGSGSALSMTLLEEYKWLCQQRIKAIIHDHSEDFERYHLRLTDENVFSAKWREENVGEDCPSDLGDVEIIGMGIKNAHKVFKLAIEKQWIDLSDPRLRRDISTSDEDDRIHYRNMYGHFAFYAKFLEKLPLEYLLLLLENGPPLTGLARQIFKSHNDEKGELITEGTSFEEIFYIVRDRGFESWDDFKLFEKAFSEKIEDGLHPNDLEKGDGLYEELGISFSYDGKNVFSPMIVEAYLKQNPSRLRVKHALETLENLGESNSSNSNWRDRVTYEGKKLGAQVRGDVYSSNISRSDKATGYPEVRKLFQEYLQKTKK